MIKDQTEAMRHLIVNHEDLYERLCDYAADFPDDLEGAAQAYADRVLGPIFDRAYDAVHPLVREVLPTGREAEVAEMVEALMAELVAALAD